MDFFIENIINFAYLSKKKEDWMKLFLSHIHASFSRKMHSHQYLKIKSIITGQSPFLSIKIKQTQIKMLNLAQIIFHIFFIILMAVKREWPVTKKNIMIIMCDAARLWWGMYRSGLLQWNVIIKQTWWLAFSMIKWH